MEIPTGKLANFASELIEECRVSVKERLGRGAAYRNVFLTGDESGNPAVYNKTFAYIDDLESLLYSPVGLRFNIEHYGTPSPAERAKGHTAASHLHSYIRQSDSDTMMSDGVQWGLVKGKAFIKGLWGRQGLAPILVQPEMMGVLQEHLTKLDENMEAFVHSSFITPYQLARRLFAHPNKRDLERRAKKYMKPPKDGGPGDDNAMKQIIIGGLYPFQPAGSPMPNTTRGIVDWMGGPSPTLAPNVLQRLIRLDELWVWDDNRQDWATFQMVGNDVMLMGEDFIANALAWDPATKAENPVLKGHHPFVEFAPNRLDGYFWGRSEIVNIALLQIAINSRINGINGLLRMSEDPPKKFTGGTGVNQKVLSLLSRPGGYYADANPNAKVENMAPQLDPNLWESLHEYERMFDEMGGLPPLAKGKGEAGVRSAAHAETLVRMFSPRFKDRALLVERDVESFGGLALDLCRAHVPDKMTAWVPKADAGIEGGEPSELEPAPAPGQVPVDFLFTDLAENVRLTVDSHSSSPAFAAEARALAFDLVKLGAMSPEELVRHVDAPDPEELISDIDRKKAAEAALIQQHPELLTKGHAGGGKKK